MIAIAIILFLAVLVWDIISDYKKWLNERSVNHSRDALVRGILLTPTLVCFTIGHPANNWTSLVYSLMLTFFLFWTLFDGLYNVIRGYDWWYTGTDDADDAKTDNFLQRLKLWQHIFIKIGGCIAAIILYTWL